MSSSMYKMFGTDENLEKSGVWIDYGDFRILIARSGGMNKKFVSVAETETKPYRRAIAAGMISEEVLQKVMHKIFAKAVVLDWQVKDGKEWKRGIPNKDGSLGEFNQDNIIATFEALPALFKDIQSQADTIAIFQHQELEDDSKN